MNVFTLFMLVTTFATYTTTLRHGRRSTDETLKKLKLAFEHGVRLQIEGACKDAKPQVIYVNSTDPSKVYIPRGTILHRCNDQTGCCADASHSCQPIEKETVNLYFLTYTLNTSSNSRQHHHHRKQQRQEFEKMTFTNHTQCGCRPISSSSQDDEDEDDSSLNSDEDLNEV